ncbi:MAG: transcription termination factor NusA [Elusimicrobiota bacterium]
MESNLKPVLEQIEREKGIPKEEVKYMLETALKSAFKKHAQEKDVEYSAKVNPETGDIKVYAEKEVVEKVDNPGKEINKMGALKIDPAVKPGDKVKVEVPADKFGRIAAQTARQIIIQKMRENERDSIYQEFKKKEGQIVSGTIYRFTKKSCILEVGRTQAILPKWEQIKRETLKRGDNLRVYVIEVKKAAKGPKIFVSRTHPGLVARLFRLEVPEIAEGVVEIERIVRNPGIRCKVAVKSNNERVDPIGACVGINGVRVQSVINELHGERMDLIKYSEDEREYLKSSLSPAQVSDVIILDEDKREARLVVEDDMLSLSIGRNGQNVRLAARLTNWHLDIQSKTQMKELAKKQMESEEEEEEDKEEKTAEGISQLDGVGPKTAGLLKEAGYETSEAVAEAKEKDLEEIPGIGKKTAQKILESAREQINE